MTPEEIILYTERYTQLKAKLKAAGEDVEYLEFPNCWLAVEAGAVCTGPGLLREVASRGRLDDEDIPVLFEAADAYEDLDRILSRRRVDPITQTAAFWEEVQRDHEI